MDKNSLGQVRQQYRFFGSLPVLRHIGFEERIKGDHHIFTRNDIEEIINIQPHKNKAKLYQVKQVRNLLVKYKIGEIEND